MKTDGMIVSFEGIGSSGKTTQSDLLAANLWKRYNVSVHKMINRKLLESVIKPLLPFSSKPNQRLWVIDVPEVEEGTDLLVYMALMKQRLAEISAAGGSAPRILILGRYIDSVFAHSATRIVLGEMARMLGVQGAAPEDIAKRMLAESSRKTASYDGLLAKYAGAAEGRCKGRIESLYKAFTGLRHIVRWPDITVVLDVRAADIKGREVRRENRAFSPGDVLYFAITSDIYKFLAKKEPKRVSLVNGIGDREEIAKDVLKIVTRKGSLAAYEKRGRRQIHYDRRGNTKRRL